MNGRVSKEEFIKYLQDKNFDYVEIVDHVFDRSGVVHGLPEKVLLTCKLILKSKNKN